MSDPRPPSRRRRIKCCLRPRARLRRAACRQGEIESSPSPIIRLKRRLIAYRSIARIIIRFRCHISAEAPRHFLHLTSPTDNFTQNIMLCQLCTPTMELFSNIRRAKKNANSIAYQKNINIGEPLTQIPILLDLLINLHLLVNVLVVICQSAYHW